MVAGDEIKENKGGQTATCLLILAKLFDAILFNLSEKKNNKETLPFHMNFLTAGDR